MHENGLYENIDFSEKELFNEEFVKCQFLNCNFSKSNLRSTDFIDCIFTGCNFSLAILNNTGVKDVQFVSCKLMGVNFSACNNFLFSVTFEGCHLDYSSFFQKKMQKTKFTNCSLKEVDFEEADLSRAAFNNCNMEQARFIKTNLERADFRTAQQYALDPGVNKVKKTRFTYPGVLGLLAKYDIDVDFE